MMETWTFAVEFVDDLDVLKNKGPRQVTYVTVEAGPDANLCATQIAAAIRGVPTETRLVI